MANIKLHEILCKYFIFILVLIGQFSCAQNQTTHSEIQNKNKIFTPAFEMSNNDWNNTAELERVWQAGLVRIPIVNDGYVETTVADLSNFQSSLITTLPTVIYLHGCSGIWAGTIRRIDFLARNGFAVIAPPSMTRKKYAKSCEPENHRAGLYRNVLRIRQADAEYAIRKAKRLS